jgi:FKBP-type peptidyl-prolyl cis-trans isomerase 2
LAKAGDIVRVHYTGKLRDGSVFDTSLRANPLEFTLGERRVIAGFEEAVVGMEPGQEKTAVVPPEKGYGPRRPELVVQFERNKVPPEIDLEIGKKLQLNTQGGQTKPARIVDIGQEAITLDANHPLAGQQLTFDIQLVDVVSEA